MRHKGLAVRSRKSTDTNSCQVDRGFNFVSKLRALIATGSDEGAIHRLNQGFRGLVDNNNCIFSLMIACSGPEGSKRWSCFGLCRCMGWNCYDLCDIGSFQCTDGTVVNDRTTRWNMKKFSVIPIIVFLQYIAIIVGYRCRVIMYRHVQE